MSPSVPLVAQSVGLVAREALRAGFDRGLPTGGAVPLRSSGITSRWLEGAMKLRPGAIRSARVVDEHHGTALRARIAVDADPGVDVPNHLFAKLTPKNLQQHLLMNVMDLGKREVLFYRAIAPEAPIRVPRCYAAEVDARRGRNVMVLEDLSGRARFRDIREPCDTAEAEAMVDALADLHGAFWQTDRFTTDLGLLVGRSPAATFLGNLFVRRILGDLKGQAADIVPGDIQRKSRVLFECKEGVDAFWAAEPQTVIHGDPHLGNLFFEGAAPGLLDWQAVMAGPGIRDVAYFVVASVETQVARKIERGLVDRYAARLGTTGVTVDADQLWTRYRAAVSEFYISAVVTAGTGERMQPQEISRVGVERVVAAVKALETFDVLAALMAGERV